MSARRFIGIGADDRSQVCIPKCASPLSRHARRSPATSTGAIALRRCALSGLPPSRRHTRQPRRAPTRPRRGHRARPHRRTRQRIAETAAAGRLDAQRARAFAQQRERRRRVRPCRRRARSRPPSPAPSPAPPTPMPVGRPSPSARNEYSASRAILASNTTPVPPRHWPAPPPSVRNSCRTDAHRIQLLIRFRVRQHQSAQRHHRSHLVEAVAPGDGAGAGVAAPVVHHPRRARFVRGPTSPGTRSCPSRRRRAAGRPCASAFQHACA